jgi:dihydropteroate synthase
VKIIKIEDSAQAAEVFKKIGVDPYGIAAMAQKTICLNVLLADQPCKIANIIKQEMLSVGGDAAVARGSVACSIKKTDILIMGTLKQIKALITKIDKQPFGLNIIAQELRQMIENYGRKEYILKTAQREIHLGKKTLVMGILNVTPDSFSDGGLYYSQQKAIDYGLQMIADGADIIDIGGESTRPGAAAVSAKDELKRVIPVICGLSRQKKIPLSIDTTKAQVAGEAVAAGAEIVNDVSALQGDRRMAKTVRENGAALILIHMRGKPQNMQKGNLTYNDLMNEIVVHLQKSVAIAVAAGIGKGSLVIDPGIGFGKTPEDNYRIINNLAELKALGLPIMVGTSRKSFIGRITCGDPPKRIEGTAATVTAAILNGCHIVRVHDVAFMKKVAAVTDAIVRI